MVRLGRQSGHDGAQAVTWAGSGPAILWLRSGPGRGFARRLLPVVDELQGQAEVRLLEQGDHGLQVVLLLAADPQLVTLDLRLYPTRPLVADLLADRLGLVRVDALNDLAFDPVYLAGHLGLPGIQRLQRDVALDQPLLEHVQRRPGA